MIFYDCSTAPSPRRARMFIAEKGVEIETREVDIGKGEQLGEAFLKVNPGGTVPVLVTEAGNVLTENLGIAAYLEKVFPEPPLLGRDAEETGAVFMWNAICEAQGFMPLAEVLRNTSPRMKGRAIPGPVDIEQIPELAERGRLRLGLFYDKIEQRLAESPFLASDQFTLADITGFVLCEFSRVIRMTVPEENRATQAWLARIRERPSAQV